MNVDQIKQILQNKLQTLHNMKMDAINTGDLELVVKIDTELLETESTLNKL
jgi:hypothetical protein